MPVFNLIHYRPEGDGGTGSEGGSGTGGDGGSGDNGGSQGDGGDGGSGSGSGAPSVESLQAELKKTRDEAAKNRRERNELQKRIDALEAKDKTETERLTESQTKLTQERDALEAKSRRLVVRALAPQAGIAQSAAGDAADLFKPSDSLDWDDESAVIAELKAFVKDRPHLAGGVRNGADGGEGGSRESTDDMNSLIRQAAGRG